MRLPLISGRAISARWTAIRRRPCAHRGAAAVAAESLLADYDKEHGRLPAKLRRARAEPTVLPRGLSQPVGKRRRRHAVAGDQHSADNSASCSMPAALIDNPSLTTQQSDGITLPGPDFPTGGIILAATASARLMNWAAFADHARPRPRSGGRGGRESTSSRRSPTRRKGTPARTHRRGGTRQAVEGIAEVRDESDRDGVRLVVELKRRAMADVVLNQLYRFTPCKTSVRRHIRWRWMAAAHG